VQAHLVSESVCFLTAHDLYRALTLQLLGIIAGFVRVPRGFHELDIPSLDLLLTEDAVGPHSGREKAKQQPNTNHDGGNMVGASWITSMFVGSGHVAPLPSRTCLSVYLDLVV